MIPQDSNEGRDGMLPAAHGSPSSIIAQLLEMMPESVKNASDEDLLEGFLDMNAEQAVRDTSQALLEARKYLRHGDALRMDVQGLLLAVMSDENQLGIMTKAGIRGMLARHPDLLPETSPAVGATETNLK